MLNHKNCLKCAEILTNNKELSLLERVSVKNDDSLNFKVKKHKLIEKWQEKARSGEVMRII